MADALNISISSCTYGSFPYLNVPTSAMAECNGALDTIPMLAYDGLHVAFTVGAAAFAMDLTNASFDGIAYLPETTAVSLRSSVMAALNTVPNLAYGDVAVTSSRSI